MMTIDNILAALMLILAGFFVWKFVKSPVVEIKVEVVMPTPTFTPLPTGFTDLYDANGELKDKQMQTTVDNIAKTLQELMLDPDQMVGGKGAE